MQISLDNFSRVMKYAPLFGRGLVVTVLLSLVTVLLGFILAFILAMMSLSSVKILRAVSTVYVQIVRCTPMMVQVLIMYYLLTGIISFPRVFLFGYIEVGRFIPAAISLALNSGGYMSDVIRGGIEGIDQATQFAVTDEIAVNQVSGLFLSQRRNEIDIDSTAIDHQGLEFGWNLT